MADQRDPAETRARKIIDRQLTEAGWHVCDRNAIDLVNNKGVAVREVHLGEAGRADYILFLDRRVVGVIEAKPKGQPLTGVEWQSNRYAEGLPPEFKLNALLINEKLPFIFEASGSETHFTNVFDPEPRARSIFNFPQPETLARIVRSAADDADAPTWRAKVKNLPAFDHYDLRPASRRAITNLENSLAENRYDRSLIQMATGAGKTRMAVTEAYRLLKYADFNRILFLVDRNNLGDQTLAEFRDWTTPDDGRKFTELYNVDKLKSAGMVESSKVVISTIQRVNAALKGQVIDDSDDPSLDEFVPEAPVEVVYQSALPPEAFDLIIVDECHRSIYGQWRAVLEYFDAHIVGLTATPVKQTFGFFKQNLVSEYTYAESVADGVNVDFDVYRIETKITAEGAKIEAGAVIPVMDKRTRVERYETLNDDVEYTSTELHRKVQSKDQIRLILSTFRDRLFTEIFPPSSTEVRTTVPKTLIFAIDDNHAEEIVTQVREVFGKGNDFAAKITYNAKDPKDLLSKFRNSPTLRIAVTVDMIATGTDVKPIECVFFMRDVRSAAYFEQMKGRGARTIDDATFTALTPDATHKDRFVIVDAVGVTEHDYVDAAPLQRDKSISLKALLEKAANFTINQDEVATLASRLSRLERQLTPEEKSEIFTVAGESLTQVTQRLITVVDSDAIHAAIQATPARADGSPDEATAMTNLIHKAIEPLAGKPELRLRLLELRASHDLYIDEQSQDEVLHAGAVAREDMSRQIVDSWKQYLEDNKEEISALEVIYTQKSAPHLAFAQLKELAERISRPPHQWTVEKLWEAYEKLDADKVRHADRHTVTDLVALVRYTIGFENELIPFVQSVEEKYQAWLLQQEQAGVHFTEQQRWWLDRIKETIAQSIQVTPDSLELAPFTERGGIDGAIRDLGASIQMIMSDLNERLTA